MQKGCRRNAIVYSEMQRTQMGCKEDTTKLPKDAGDAKWMQQAYADIFILDARHALWMHHKPHSVFPSRCIMLWICWWEGIATLWIQGMQKGCRKNAIFFNLKCRECKWDAERMHFLSPSPR